MAEEIEPISSDGIESGRNYMHTMKSVSTSCAVKPTKQKGNDQPGVSRDSYYFFL